MSIFSINGDKKLNPLQLFYWFCFNAIRNIFHSNIDDSLVIKRPKFSNIVKFIDVSSDRSPCRRVSDMFWKSLPIDAIYKELGMLNVFEVGCGKGNYGLFLSEILGKHFEHYTGIDICKSQEWENFDKNSFSFIEGNADNFRSEINNSNLIITQSALEHFPNDEQYFDQVLDYASNNNRPIIQIHLMPSSACLKLYLLHGYRQYTPFWISKISKKFRFNSKKILYSLGGINVNRVHYKYWTKKGISSDSVSQLYNESFKNSLLNDGNSQLSVKDTSFYCLVIFHNVSTEFYDKFLNEV
jgi:SAM-dependent methyltransferase